MPFKLIGMIILLVIVTVFCGFNSAENARCDVNLLFRQFHDVPVFLTVLVSFVAGAVVSLPFTFGRRRAKGAKTPKAAKKQALRAPVEAPEVKVTVRPGTLYDPVPARASPAAREDAPAASAGAPSPFAAACENARERAASAKAKRDAEKARARAEKERLRAEKKQASKKKGTAGSTVPHEPSVNDVPKIHG